MNQSVTLTLSTSTSAFERGVAAAIALLGQLGTTASQTGTQITNYATNLNTRLTAAYSAADARQRVFDAGLGRLGNNLQSTGTKLSAFLTAPLLAAGAAAFKTYGDIDALKRGLAVIEGPAGNVNARFKELREVAALPGLGLEEAVKGDIRLRAVGISAALSKKSLLEFGNAIALTGGGKAELDRVTTQLGQMAAKGKVLGNDLRPVIEAATAAAPVIKRLFGTIDPEAISDKLAAAGKTSTDFIEAITGGLADLQRVSGGPKNAIENLGDAMKIASYEFMSAADKSLNLTDKLNGVGSFIGGLATAFSNLSPTTQKIILGLIGAAAALGPVILGIGYLIPLLPALGTAFTVGFAAITGPVGIAVAAIAAGTYIIISNWDSIKKVLVDTGIWDTVKNAVTTAVTGISNAFSATVGFLRSLWTEFGGGIIATGQAAFETVSVLVKYYMDLVSAEINIGVSIAKALWEQFGDTITNVAMGAFTTLSGIVGGAFTVIGGLFSTVTGVLTGIFKTLTGILTGDWSKMGEGLQNITVSLWNGVIALFIGGVKATGGVLAGFLQQFGANDLATSVTQQIGKITAGAEGLKLSLQGAKTAATGAAKAVAQIPVKKELKKTETTEKAKVDYLNVGGDSLIKKLKDQQKKLAEQIQSGNASGQDTTALQSQYDALTRRINAATESTKKHKAASNYSEPMTSMGQLQGMLKRLTDEASKFTVDKIPASLSRQIAGVTYAIADLKARTERTVIKLPEFVSPDGIVDNKIVNKTDPGRLADAVEASQGKMKLPKSLGTVIANWQVQAKFELDDKAQALSSLKQQISQLTGLVENTPEFTNFLDKALLKSGSISGVIQKILEPLSSLKGSIGSSLRGAAEEGIAGMAQLVGGLITGASGMASLPALFGGILAGLAESIGKAMISFGVAGIALQQLELNPFTALAAGAGLLVLASVLRSTVSSQVKGGGSGGQKFAKGGVFDSPTYGLFGEYAGAAHNKEIATPQKLMADTFRSELNKDAYRQSSPRMASGSGSQRVEVVVSGSLKGEDIHFSGQRYAERNSDLTGS